MKWTETISIDRPLDEVRGAVADEHALMAWSAWPEATGYSCDVEGDGRALGSQIVFRDRHGRERGRQTLTAVTDERISYRLNNAGPFGRRMEPELDFRLEDAGDATMVHLDFRADVPLPPPARQLIDSVMGRRVRRLHRQDLRQLKDYVEQAPTDRA